MSARPPPASAAFQSLFVGIDVANCKLRRGNDEFKVERPPLILLNLFGLRNAMKIQSRVDDGLRQVGLAGFGDRMIAELSGGRQQRVALARVIVTQPSVPLFDEPLSNLDAQMRSEIRRLQKELGSTIVSVTRDQEEAMAISDRIAVMNAGQIIQVGNAEDLYPGHLLLQKFGAKC